MLSPKPSSSQDQISAKQGTDSKFEGQANLKALVPKSKRSSIIIYETCVHTNSEA